MLLADHSFVAHKRNNKTGSLELMSDLGASHHGMVVRAIPVTIKGR